MATSTPQPAATSYHCAACTQLLFATTTPLASLPRRQADKSTILPISPHPTALAPAPAPPHFAALHRPLHSHLSAPRPSTPDSSDAAIGRTTAAVLRLPDGFETRAILRCPRCAVPWAYMLHWAQWAHAAQSGPREDVVYVLAGGVVDTKAMLGP